jgi:DNA-binding NarL/FixJ family response regulator
MAEVVMEEIRHETNGHGVRRKLLFADDHQLVLDAVTFVAGPHFEVKTTDTLKSFESQIDAFDPDLAVLDIRMPDGDGFEAAKRVLERKPQQKIIFLSMHTEPRVVKRAMELGAKGYLSKRAPLDELLKAIESVLGGGTYIGSNLDTEAVDELAPEGMLTDRQINCRQAEHIRAHRRIPPCRYYGSPETPFNCHDDALRRRTRIGLVGP